MAEKYPRTIKDVPATFVRANSTYALLDHPNSVAGKPDSMKMSDAVAKFISKIPAGSKVLISYQVDEWGSKTLTYIARTDATQGATPAAETKDTPQTSETSTAQDTTSQNANTGGMVPDRRTDTPEIPGKVPNSDWSIGGAITKKDRMIILQTCIKTAGEVYAATGGKPDPAPAIITEWAIFMSRGIIAEVNQE
ncbi:MAG: hypothetical protein BWY93_02112 [Euryarchaeota archaeon ADurb.BinA087]|nr:MAG: hypothetical protein BWY93_02112 [Euryarchaeota archaeon ADurb.BinA087]